MIRWEEFQTDMDGNIIYARVSEDGKIRLTAVRGYPELDAYLAWVEAGNNPEDFWTQDEALLTEGEEE